MFPWSCEGKLGVLLESLQGQRDLIEACVQDLIFLSREDRDFGFPFQTPPGSQASPRGEAEDFQLQHPNIQLSEKSSLSSLSHTDLSFHRILIATDYCLNPKSNPSKVQIFRYCYSGASLSLSTW